MGAEHLAWVGVSYHKMGGCKFDVVLTGRSVVLGFGGYREEGVRRTVS